MQHESEKLRQAYSICRKIALGHYENFPVGSVLLPEAIRADFFALYAFMRTADDFADLPTRTRDQRLEVLAHWRQQLHAALSTDAPREHLNPIFLALGHTARKHHLSLEPFDRLLDAFEFDARGGVRFETFNDLLWYCDRSANPVGELVLALFGYRDPRRIELSNKVCTSLQLLNFCQDVREDLDSGRCYFPNEDLVTAGVADRSVLSEPQNARRAVLLQVQHIKRLLREGAPLTEQVGGRLKYELRAVVNGALALLELLRKMDGNSYLTRPKLTKAAHLGILLQSMVSKPVVR